MTSPDMRFFRGKPVPEGVLAWVREMGALHLMIGQRFIQGWDDLTITNVSDTNVHYTTSYSVRPDGKRILELHFEMDPVPDVAQLTLEGVRGLLPSPKPWWAGLATPDRCEFSGKRRKGPCQNTNNLVWCQNVGGTLLTLCRYHAHRGRRDKWVRAIAGEVTP